MSRENLGIPVQVNLLAKYLQVGTRDVEKHVYQAIKEIYGSEESRYSIRTFRDQGIKDSEFTLNAMMMVGHWGGRLICITVAPDMGENTKGHLVELREMVKNLPLDETKMVRFEFSALRLAHKEGLNVLGAAELIRPLGSQRRYLDIVYPDIFRELVEDSVDGQVKNNIAIAWSLYFLKRGRRRRNEELIVAI